MSYITKNIKYKPSVYAHILSSLIILFGLIIIIRNYKEISKLDTYKILILILLVSLVIGVHSLGHLGLETSYGLDMSYFWR
jgi:hypothetical protein